MYVVAALAQGRLVLFDQTSIPLGLVRWQGWSETKSMESVAGSPTLQQNALVVTFVERIKSAHYAVSINTRTSVPAV